MIVFVFWTGPEYAGQVWWDGERPRQDGPDPLHLRLAMEREFSFAPDDLIEVDPDMRGKVASVVRKISSEDDLGMLYRYGTAKGAEVEQVESDAAPIDPKSTPYGKRVHGTLPVPRGERPPGKQTVH